MMKIDDILQVALQNAGLNLEELTEYENTNLSNVENELVALGDDPFTQAVRELETHNKKVEVTLVSSSTSSASTSPTPNSIKNDDINSLLRFRNQPHQKSFTSQSTPLQQLSTQTCVSSMRPQQIQKNQIKVVHLSTLVTPRLTPKIQHTHKHVQITKVVSSRVQTQSIGTYQQLQQQQQQQRSHVYFNPLASISNASSYYNASHTNSPQLSTPLIRVSNNQENNNTHTKLYYQQTQRNQQASVYEQLDEEIVVDEEEELGHAETYADYMPSKLKLGIRHPDPVVETSSLSSVEPPEIAYHLHIPEYVYNDGALSALQLEAMVYACQKHETFLPNNHRAGFLIGDGAGVGKGRTIAGIIYENYLLKRKKALWLSVSNDLKYDAQRDFNDICAQKIAVHSLNKLKYAKISSKTNSKIKKGVIFATYSSLIGESQQANTKKKYNTRMKQLLQWLGKDFDGIIVFDECHKAKNLVPVGSAKPTKTGLAVLELQEKLPNARVVYASATGASEPKNMAYMVRLGLWGPATPFNDFNEFIQCIEKRGIGAMEIVAMDMKLRGMYMARQLSFSGTTFKIQEIKLGDDYVKMYDDSVLLWVRLKEKFQEALDLVDKDGKLRKTVWGQFWSSHQRFFKYLCMACKVSHVVDIARNALHSGKCVVIGLQSTGEARTLEQIDELGEISEFVSTAKGVLQNLIDKHFPTFDTHKSTRSINTQSSKHQSFLDILGIGDHVREQINKKQQSKNSKKVNDILKRLSSYASTIEEKKIPENKKSAKYDTSSSTSSESNSSDENDDASCSNFNHQRESNTNNDSLTEKSQQNSEYYDSDEWTEETIEDEDTLSHFGSLSSHVDSSKSDMNNNRIKETKSLQTNNDSNDSDSLFSINRSCITFHRNPVQPKKKRLVKRRVKRTQHEVKHEKQSSDEDEFKQPSKRLKIEKKPLIYEEVKKSNNQSQMREYLNVCKKELLLSVSQLSKYLPANTLDELIDRLDGPEYVAEMTGRKGRIVCVDEEIYKYESRSETDVPLELMNIVQKERFLSGEKLIAIISEAASSGISLQANRRCENQRRRVHITIELPWSADRAIQQFGRTHRSNQVSAPEYIFLISELAGEKRFASTVAKRLESLGALTHGDRRATETRDLSRFNIDNKYGRQALENVIKSICGIDKPLAKPPQDYKGNFFADACIALVGVGIVLQTSEFGFNPDKDYTNMNKFLNRLLGCPVHLQNAIFNYFNDVLATVILEAKRTGKWDMGILDLGSNNETVYQKETKFYALNTDSYGLNRRVELHAVLVERGMNWDKAVEMSSDVKLEQEGFYLSNQVKNNHRIAILAICAKNTNKNDVKESNIISFCIYRPNTGLQLRQETLETLLKKYKKVSHNEAKFHWQEQYYKSVNECTHVYRQGICTNRRNCEIGLRNRKFHILAGSVLTVWTRVENVLSSLIGQTQYRLQIIRIRTSDDKKIVGCVIPNTSVTQVDALLESISSKTYKHQYSIEINQLISIQPHQQQQQQHLRTTPKIQHNHNQVIFRNSFQNLIPNKNS